MAKFNPHMGLDPCYEENHERVIMSFKKFIKELPASARKFDNGDVCIKKDEYVKGEAMFGYYKPTPKGFSLEKTCWKGAHAAQYNWAKVNNPDFKETPKKTKRVTESELLFTRKLKDDLDNNPESFTDDEYLEGRKRTRDSGILDAAETLNSFLPRRPSKVEVATTEFIKHVEAENKASSNVIDMFRRR